ncbi:dienelactone hydrolase family protein [Caballeronia sp. LjRoot34]
MRARDGGEFHGYLALPTSTESNGRGLVILPEVYNVNSWLRSVVKDYAHEGYAVLSPDVFWRQEPDIHLGYDQPERARSRGDALDVDRVVEDVGVAAAYLRKLLGSHVPVGVIGFCLGGRLAALAGVREQVQAVSCYYGVRLEDHARELARLAVPAAFHFGETDPWVPLATVETVHRAIEPLPDAKVFVYSNVGHGFARSGYQPYDAAADRLAKQRTRELFDRALRG